MSEAVLNFEERTAPGSEEKQAVQVIPGDGIEINNNKNQPNIEINNEMVNPISVPIVKEIVIPRPTAQGRDRPQRKEPKAVVFDF